MYKIFRYGVFYYRSEGLSNGIVWKYADKLTQKLNHSSNLWWKLKNLFFNSVQFDIDFTDFSRFWFDFKSEKAESYSSLGCSLHFFMKIAFWRNITSIKNKGFKSIVQYLVPIMSSGFIYNDTFTLDQQYVICFMWYHTYLRCRIYFLIISKLFFTSG